MTWWSIDSCDSNPVDLLIDTIDSRDPKVYWCDWEVDLLIIAPGMSTDRRNREIY
nr:hypothetical protein Iba_chr02cCG9600 [Ipomoea batatas]